MHGCYLSVLPSEAEDVPTLPQAALGEVQSKTDQNQHSIGFHPFHLAACNSVSNDIIDV